MGGGDHGDSEISHTQSSHHRVVSTAQVPSQSRWKLKFVCLKIH